MEIGGRALAFRLDERRSPGPRLVALRALDLDDVGAEIGERLPGGRAGEHAREFENAQAGERGRSKERLQAGLRAPKDQRVNVMRAFVGVDRLEI